MLQIECTANTTFDTFYASLCEKIGYPAFIPLPYWPPTVREDNQPDLSPKPDKATMLTELQTSEFELKIRARCDRCRVTTSQGNFCCNCCGSNFWPE